VGAWREEAVACGGVCRRRPAGTGGDSAATADLAAELTPPAAPGPGRNAPHRIRMIIASLAAKPIALALDEDAVHLGQR
jgi:hypothetical protein